MLFSNHLVNIAYIHEEGTAMAQIRIHVLHCGKIGVAPNLPASAQWRWPAKADARRLKSGARIWLPVSAYLVEHPKGLFLVDAGLPRTVSPTGIEDRAAQLRMFGRGWYTLVHSVVKPGQSIGEQLVLFSGVAEAAPSIYPVDTARFLGGSRFDFKVEFDGELAEKDAKVLINGQDAKAVLGAKPEFIAKEKGADASALLLRGARSALRSSPDSTR